VSHLTQSFKSQSLKYQLFEWLLILILPLIVISAIASYFMAHQYINKAYDKTLYRSALAIADQVTLETLGAQVDLPSASKDLLEYDEEDAIYFRVVGPQGDLINTHTSLPLPKTFPNTDQALYYESVLNDDAIRVVIYALPNLVRFAPNAKDKHIYVLVGETLKKRDIMTDEILIGILLPQLLIAFIFCGLLFFGINRGLAPLDNLKKNLTHRDLNDLSPLDNTSVPTELQPLLNGFNDLLKRLGLNMAQQKRFVSDAAHQLRTPLAGLKTQTELALREPNQAKIATSLTQINQASVNLTHLVNQLLSLTKADPDNLALSLTDTIDLVRFAKEVCMDWVPSALEKQIDLGFESDLSNSTIRGNAILLRELINNLIDNAIRYTPDNGNITVGINRNHQGIVLFVKDNGMGVSEEDQARIFERFFRVSGTQQDGSGLGLSIVQEIAKRHHATVLLESQGEGYGTLMTVQFTNV